MPYWQASSDNVAGVGRPLAAVIGAVYSLKKQQILPFGDGFVPFVGFFGISVNIFPFILNIGK